MVAIYHNGGTRGDATPAQHRRIDRGDA